MANLKGGGGLESLYIPSSLDYYDVDDWEPTKTIDLIQLHKICDKQTWGGGGINCRVYKIDI